MAVNALGRTNVNAPHFIREIFVTSSTVPIQFLISSGETLLICNSKNHTISHFPNESNYCYKINIIPIFHIQTLDTADGSRDHLHPRKFLTKWQRFHIFVL